MLTSCIYVGNSSWLCKDAVGDFTMRGSTSSGYSISNANNSVYSVYLYNQKLNSFPRGFGSYFSHLKSITISCCGLKVISRDDLIGLENLEYLAVTSNPLASLPSDLFTGMTKLKSVSFNSNKLETMSSKLLEPILKNKPNLIDFRENVKINAFYNSKVPNFSIQPIQLMKLIDLQCNKPAGEEDHISSIDSFEKDLALGFADLWASGEHSDFTICAKGRKKFQVHKTVLAMQSSVFAAMFKSNMEEQQTGKMTILDFSAEAVEQFLACLYTGKIKDVTNAMELFALAAKYDFPKLKVTSEHNVLLHIDSSNAYDVFVLGHLYSSTVLKRKSFDVLKQTLPDLNDDLMTDPERLKAMMFATEKHNM